MPRTPDDALAAYRPPRFYRSESDPLRPVQARLDSEGARVAAEWPSPLALRDIYALPVLSADREFFRTGKALLTRQRGSQAPPRPVALEELVDELLGALHALQPRADEQELRKDLRRFLAIGSPERVREYARATIRTLTRSHDGVPLWAPPKPPRPVASTLTPAAFSADYRRRLRDEQATAGRHWLASFLDSAAPGETVEAANLWRDASAELGAAAPGRTLFYRLADEVLGERRRIEHRTRTVYTIPQHQTAQEPHVNLDQIRAEAAAYREAADEAERLQRLRQELYRSGDKVGALLAQHDELAARRATRAA